MALRVVCGCSFPYTGSPPCPFFVHVVAFAVSSHRVVLRSVNNLTATISHTYPLRRRTIVRILVPRPRSRTLARPRPRPRRSLLSLSPSLPSLFLVLVPVARPRLRSRRSSPFPSLVLVLVPVARPRPRASSSSLSLFVNLRLPPCPHDLASWSQSRHARRTPNGENRGGSGRAGGQQQWDYDYRQTQACHSLSRK